MLDPQPDSSNREETRPHVAMLPPLTPLLPICYLPGTGAGTPPAKPAPLLETDGKAPRGHRGTSALLCRPRLGPPTAGFLAQRHQQG